MKPKTQTILIIMHVLSWLAFVDFFIQAGAIITSYIVSIYNPAASANMYMKLNLSALMDYDMWQYSFTVSFMVAILALKIYTAWLVITVLRTIKLASPFTAEVSKLLEQVSYFILATWVVTIIHNEHTKWMMKTLPVMKEHVVSGDFIWLAGIVFIMSQIFKKGVEIQSENELTV